MRDVLASRRAQLALVAGFLAWSVVEAQVSPGALLSASALEGLGRLAARARAARSLAGVPGRRGRGGGAHAGHRHRRDGAGRACSRFPSASSPRRRCSAPVRSPRGAVRGRGCCSGRTWSRGGRSGCSARCQSCSGRCSSWWRWGSGRGRARSRSGCRTPACSGGCWRTSWKTWTRCRRRGARGVGGAPRVARPLRAAAPGVAAAGGVRPVLARVRHPLGVGPGLRRRRRHRAGDPAVDAALRVPAGLDAAARAPRADAGGRGAEPGAPPGEPERAGVGQSRRSPSGAVAWCGSGRSSPSGCRCRGAELLGGCRRRGARTHGALRWRGCSPRTCHRRFLASLPAPLLQTLAVAGAGTLLGVAGGGRCWRRWRAPG